MENGRYADGVAGVVMDEISWALFHRVNPEKNEKRFYYLKVGPSLLDEYAVLRMWGRIGGHQRGMVTPCASAEEAQTLARRLVKVRLRRGYRVVYPAALRVEEEQERLCGSFMRDK
jgi:predicted DNA-binding WGR domain protein